MTARMTAPAIPESGRLTLREFSARYQMDARTAAKWIESGTAPGMRIPGTNRFHITVEWCDRFDRGDCGRWTPNHVAVPSALPDFRPIRLVRKAG